MVLIFWDYCINNVTLLVVFVQVIFFRKNTSNFIPFWLPLVFRSSLLFSHVYFLSFPLYLFRRLMELKIKFFRAITRIREFLKLFFTNLFSEFAVPWGGSLKRSSWSRANWNLFFIFPTNYLILIFLDLFDDGVYFIIVHFFRFKKRKILWFLKDLEHVSYLQKTWQCKL